MRGGVSHLSSIEVEAYARGFSRVGGVDEAGRGPLAGPVVAAAVVLPRGFHDPEIKDSKLLTPEKRLEVEARIKEQAVAWGLGIVEAEEIDRINILKASLLAMAHAFGNLRPAPDCLLIDGPHEIPRSFFVASLTRYSKDEYAGNEYADNALPYQRPIVKGDRLSISIAAASILAKVARDRIMEQYDRLYPGYGFVRHKGYGSAEHLAALRRLGPAPIHRRSFRPVRESLNGVLVTR